MTDKQAFVAILGGTLSAIPGGALLILLTRLIDEATDHRADGGADRLGSIRLAPSLLSGILGLILSAKWARKRFPRQCFSRPRSDAL